VSAWRGGDLSLDVVAVVEAAVVETFADLRRTVRRNLAVLTVAFLRVLGAARSGHGRLSLGALFRILPTEGTAHAREKRLQRFLENPRLDPRGVADGLARVIFGRRGEGVWPLLLNQTAATRARRCCGRRSSTSGSAPSGDERAPVWRWPAIG